MGTDRGPWRERLGALTERGVAIIVATCDHLGTPGLTRGWGLALVDDGDVALAVTAPPGSRTAAHLAIGSEMSVTVSEMTTYRTVQLLGTIANVLPVEDDARQRVSAHLDRFVDDAAKVGVVRDAASLFLDDLVAVRLTVVHATEQTPGDDAGIPLEHR